MYSLALHQMNNIARSKVLAGILIQCFVELADQLFEDRAHGRVVDLVGMQIDILESLQNLEKEPCLIELADGIVEIELLQDFAHVLAEARDSEDWQQGREHPGEAWRNRSRNYCRRRTPILF